MTKADIFLKNAQIIAEEDAFVGGVLIKGEKILDVIEGNGEVSATNVIDLDGKILMPGLIDGHVHFNEPGREHWEGYFTGTMAAAAGGITSVLDMPLNADPPTTNVSELNKKRYVVQEKAIVDYGNWGGLIDNNISDLEALNSEGVIGFKAFTSNSGIEEFSQINDGILYAALQLTKKLGNVIGLHAENEDVICYLTDKLKSAGRKDRASWYESRIPFSELEAIKRACFWAEKTEGNLHIVHISIPEGIQAVRETRVKGVNVTSETCPHYLFFDHQDFERIGPAAKCAPPIRSRQTVEDMWDLVLSGYVDVIGSDHSPCTWEEKSVGMDDIWMAWGGISGIQTMLPAIVTKGVHQRGLPFQEVVRMMSANPARLFGLYPNKGALKPESDADIVVVDPESEWILKSDDLLYKNKHSAYVGTTFKGRIEQTFVRGKLVYKDGKILAKPGYGKALRRISPYSLTDVVIDKKEQ
jgi:allantoinase